MIAAAPLRYVGVFRNNAISDIVTQVSALSLAAVQLHGDETPAFVADLRAALPAAVQIWKALRIEGSVPARDWPHVDRYVFDNGNGGTGERFDWSLLQGQTLDNVLLAGGLSADNCVEAAQLGCAGLGDAVVKMDICNQRHVYLLLDQPECFCGIHGRHRDTDDVDTYALKGFDLIYRRFHVRGAGVGHRLNSDWGAVTDRHLADVNALRFTTDNGCFVMHIFLLHNCPVQNTLLLRTQCQASNLVITDKTT